MDKSDVLHLLNEIDSRANCCFEDVHVVHTDGRQKDSCASERVCINQVSKQQSDIPTRWGRHLPEHMAAAISMHMHIDTHVRYAARAVI